MKKFFVFAFFLLISGCSGEQAEEFAFRKMIEYQLKNDCGEENKQCIKAVEEQMKTCMDESDWRTYLDSHEDQKEMQRFVKKFFPCFKDANGNSYFPLNKTKNNKRMQSDAAESRR